MVFLKNRRGAEDELAFFPLFVLSSLEYHQAIFQMKSKSAQIILDYLSCFTDFFRLTSDFLGIYEKTGEVRTSPVWMCHSMFIRGEYFRPFVTTSSSWTPSRYLCVMLTLSWPSRRESVNRSHPFLSCVWAKVCRQVWGEMRTLLRTPTSSAASFAIDEDVILVNLLGEKESKMASCAGDVCPKTADCCATFYENRMGKKGWKWPFKGCFWRFYTLNRLLLIRVSRVWVPDGSPARSLETVEVSGDLVFFVGHENRGSVLRRTGYLLFVCPNGQNACWLANEILIYC